MDFTSNQQAGLASLLSGMFGNSGDPFTNAMDQYKNYGAKAEKAQNPFYSAGTGAVSDYQDWLKGMKNPSQFINNMMGQYQESPWAKYQQKQAMRTANNIGSATGMTGSTPFLLQAQQNAENISSQDMNQYLQNILGINTQYGQGQQNLMTGGQNAANSLTNLYGHMGDQMGTAAAGQSAGENTDILSMILGGLKFFL